MPERSSSGIGGVAIVPALTEAARMPIGRAVAASTFGFLFPGIVGAAAHLRRVRPGRRELVVLCTTGLLGALARTSWTACA